MRCLVLLGLLIAVPAHADIRMSEALALSCLNHFKKNLSKEAADFCSCYPNTFLTKDGVKAIGEAHGVMNQDIRMLMDQAGEQCLKGKSEKFIHKAREWIEE